MENAKPVHAGPQSCAWPLSRLVATALLAMTVSILPACGRAPAETRLRQQIEAMQDAVSQRDPRGFMQGVATDFQGNGGMDRDALHNLLRGQVLAKANIGVVSGPLDVQVSGDTARVRFQVALTGGSGRFVPDSAQAYEIDSGWREEDGEWRVYYAKWETKL